MEEYNVPFIECSFTSTSEDEKVAIEKWHDGEWNEIYDHNYYWECFAGYLALRRFYHTIYVSFPYVRPWFYELIEEINSKFNNIKINVVAKKDFFAHIEKNWEECNLVFTKESEKDYRNYFYSCPLLKITFNDNYLDNALRYFAYVFIIFLRMASASERFIKPSQNVSGSVIKFMIDLNNDNLSYRSFTEYFIPTVEDFLGIDNIEIVNKVASNLRCYDGQVRQSEIVKQLHGAL